MRGHFSPTKKQETFPEEWLLWRGYFQFVGPAINRILININIFTGAMYPPGNLILLCFDFLGYTLSPRAGFPTTSTYVSRTSQKA